MNTRTIKILSSISLVIIGVFLCGFGFTTVLGHSISTICLFLGLGLILLGFVYFIKIVASNN